MITHFLTTAQSSVESGYCQTGSLCFECAKGFPAAFVALVVGCIAAGIAWRQYQTARAKLKLDLFEKRYAIFELTWQHLSDPILKNPAASDLSEFTNNIPQAGFLFGLVISDYLNEIAKNRFELRALDKIISDTSVDDLQNRRGKAIERHVELMGWFEKQANTAKDKFSPWLNFENWR